jgi:hypothetical protein
MKRWAAALVLLCAGCAANEGEPQRACTLIGCDSGASFDLGAFAEADAARLTGARIELCFNATCSEAVIEELPPPNDLRAVQVGQGEPSGRVEIWRTDPSGAVELIVHVSGAYDLFTDGDVYAVSIVGSDQVALVERSWSVTYRTSQPNGPDCEPTCRMQDTTSEL